MNYENILHTQENIATVTINRPTKLNALNVATISDLNKAFKLLSKNTDIRAIILTGSGEKLLQQELIFQNSVFSIEEGSQLAAEGQEKLFDFIENLKHLLLQLMVLQVGGLNYNGVSF
jgi:enoyl-CoA hydratase